MKDDDSMNRKQSVGRNDLCPCGSGLKYKKCCQGKVDWVPLLNEPLRQRIPHLSLRGRNLMFIDKIAAALQLDSLESIQDFATLKRAFTPTAVRSIYEVIPEIWPDNDDYARCLSTQRDDVTALYTGSYEPEAVFKALARHSLYSERILLPDPFMYPVHIKDEFNPLIHPDLHRSITVKWSFLWISLLPWIQMGLVNFVRSPSDFDPRVHREILEIQREKFRSIPELEEAADKCASDNIAGRLILDGGLAEYFFLSQSDESLLHHYRIKPDGAPFNSEKQFLQFINMRRESHPYFVKRLSGQNRELIHESSGACYETAKRICSISNSHLITDMSLRWKELEIDHKHATGRSGEWSPFAKALQNADIRVLNNIPIQTAFQIRQEQRLEPMRHFFNRVWRACREPDPYSLANVTNLAAEFDQRVREAKDEWDKIDRQLLKWLGATCGTWLSSGVVGFIPAAAAAIVTGGTGLALAHWQRKSFHNKFPAGFFLNTKT